MGVSIKQQLRKAQRERDEHKAAAIVFYQIACDLCGTLAVKAEYDRRVAQGKEDATMVGAAYIPRAGYTPDTGYFPEPL